MYKHIYKKAAQWIEENTRVLDLGTGDGSFLAMLQSEKHVEAEGVEKDSDMVASCIEKGLVVHQSDVMDGLDQYGDGSFDYVLLIGTFQELTNPQTVLNEAFRVGKRVMVAYHNFSYWRIRLKFLMSGKVPMTRSMPYLWYESPNMTFCSIIDFEAMCHRFGYIEERAAYFIESRSVGFFQNLLAEQVLVLLRRDAAATDELKNSR